MNDLIRIHESILKQFLICSGYQKNIAKTRGDELYETSKNIDIYIEKEDFFRVLLTHFFMSLDTLYNINQHMNFHLYLEDFVVFLNDHGLKTLEELDEFPDDEELSIFPCDLLESYRNISKAIFGSKLSDINEFYLSYLKAINIDLIIDLSSSNKLETSIVKGFKLIKDFIEKNKAASQLNLEHVAFNYVYNTVTKNTNVDCDKKLAFLGKTFYDSFSYDLPQYSLDTKYSEYLKNHLCVLEATLKNHFSLREKNTRNIIYSLFRANNFFDVNYLGIGEMYPNKHTFLSSEYRYLHSQLNQILIKVILRTADYDIKHIFLAIRDCFIRIDEYFFLIILGIEIDRESKEEFVYKEYKRIFEKIYERVIHLKHRSLSEIESWYEALSDSEKCSISNSLRQEIEELCSKQKEVIKSIIYDQESKYLEIIDLERLKISILKKNVSFEVDEDGFEYPDSLLYTLETYMNVYYLDYYKYEITEKMINMYNDIVDYENKKIIDKYVSELEGISKKSGYKNESTFIKSAIDKITNKSHRYFGVDIPLSLQRDYIKKLSEKSEFLRLYATSEFMYKVHIEDANSYDNMELTPIITGLLKGTEQMLKGFIEWYHHSKASFYSDIIIGNQNKNYLISENTWKEKLTIGNLSQHIVLNILPVILEDSKLQHLMHKISRSFQNWNTEIRNSKFHHSNIYAYDTNLEYIFDESYSIVRIIIQLMNLC